MSESSTNSDKIVEVDKKPVTEQGVKVYVLDTPEQLVEHAKKILQEVKKPEWDNVPIDKKLEAFQDKYKEFGRTFPIVLRHIVQYQRLYPKILERYILMCKHHPTHSVSEFQERQADYLVMIYRKEHPRCSQRELSLIRKKYIDDLKREEEYMKKVMDEVKKERDEKSKIYEKDRRQDLMGLISRCVNDIPTDLDVDLVDKKLETEIEDDTEPDSLVMLPEKKEK